MKPALRLGVVGLAMMLPAVCSGLPASGVWTGRSTSVGLAIPAAPQALDDAALAAMRGGFEAHSGLRVAFGIERLVKVNGELVAATSLNLIRDEGLLQAGGLRVFSAGAAPQLPSLGVIQIGPNNIVALDGSSWQGTVLQNSLDRQTLQNLTIVNATVNSASLLRANRLNEQLREAMVGAMRR